MPHFRRKMANEEVIALDDKWYEYPEFQKYKFKDGVMRVNRELDSFISGLGYEHDRKQRLYRAAAEL